MSRKFFSAFIVISCCLSFLASGSVRAAYRDTGEAYAEPAFQEMSRTLLLLGGMDANDPKVVDDYLAMMSCSLYQEKYKNDFEWNKIRKDAVTKILSKEDYYRVLYEVAGSLYLGRYNFDSQSFPLINRSALTNVGSMILMESAVRSVCGNPTSYVFPRQVLFSPGQPITLERLKVSAQQAERILDTLQKMNVLDRRLYVRFRVHALSARVIPHKGKMQGTLTGSLSAIDVFYDEDMTQWVMSVPVAR